MQASNRAILGSIIVHHFLHNSEQYHAFIDKDDL